MEPQSRSADEILKKYSAKIESELGPSSTTRMSSDYEKFKEEMVPKLTRYERWAKSLGNVVSIRVAEKDRVKIEKYLKIAHLDVSPAQALTLALLSMFLVFLLTLLASVSIYLINPEGLPWLHKELLKGVEQGKAVPFDTLWVDESTKFKSHSSKRLKLLIDMLPLFKRRHIMTGTPSPRSLMDLWSQIYLLDEGETLGKNFYRFRNKYFQALS